MNADLSPENPPPPGAPVVLLTGFEAFGGDPTNPSQQLVQALDGAHIGSATVVTECLPTVFDVSSQRLGELLQRHRPTIVLCTGLAGGRAALSIERVAINVDDARIADNAGAQPVDTPVVPHAPAAYFSTLPIKAMREAVLAAGVPCEISQTAGTFVCNHVFYALMHALATGPQQRQAVRGGFMHLPWLPAQGTPNLSLAQMVQGTRAALQTALMNTKDVRVAAGATH